MQPVQRRVCVSVACVSVVHVALTPQRRCGPGKEPSWGRFPRALWSSGPELREVRRVLQVSTVDGLLRRASRQEEGNWLLLVVL